MNRRAFAYFTLCFFCVLCQLSSCFLHDITKPSRGIQPTIATSNQSHIRGAYYDHVPKDIGKKYPTIITIIKPSTNYDNTITNVTSPSSKISQSSTHNDTYADAFEPPLQITYFIPLPETISLSSSSSSSCKSDQKDECMIPIYGVQPLIIAFNLPVLSLGSDILTVGEVPTDKQPIIIKANSVDGKVKGRGYWVTTSTYRFDPEDSWPTDLTFSVEINTALKSMSGQQISFASSNELLSKFPLQFRTPELTMKVNRVSSKKADELTNGTWQPLLHDANDTSIVKEAHEVPPDGIVELSFSSDVDILTNESCFFDIIDITNRTNSFPLPSKQLKISSCSSMGSPALFARRSSFHSLPLPVTSTSLKSIKSSTRCLQLQFEPPLKAMHIYVIKLKPYTRYSSRSGPHETRERMKFLLNHYRTTFNSDENVQLTGLKPFKFWPKNGEGSQLPSIQYKRVRLYMSHGLSPSTSLDDLKHQFSARMLDGKMIPISFFEILPHTSILQLWLNDAYGPQNYEILVKGSNAIRDGFDQPLQDSVLQFTLIAPRYNHMYPSKGHNHAVIIAFTPPASNSSCSSGFVKEESSIIPLSCDVSAEKSNTLVFPILYKPKYRLMSVDTHYSFTAVVVPVRINQTLSLQESLQQSPASISLKDALYIAFTRHHKNQTILNFNSMPSTFPNSSLVSITVGDFSKDLNLSERQNTVGTRSLKLDKSTGDFFLIQFHETVKDSQLSRSISSDLSHRLVLINSKYILSHYMVVPKCLNNYEDTLMPERLSPIQINIHLHTRGNENSSQIPLGEATVELWQIDQSNYVPQMPIPLASATTDTNGLAKIEVDTLQLLLSGRTRYLKYRIYPRYVKAKWILIAKTTTGEVVMSQEFKSPITSARIFRTVGSKNVPAVTISRVPHVKNVVYMNNKELYSKNLVLEWTTDRAVASPGQPLGIVGNLIIKPNTELPDTEHNLSLLLNSLQSVSFYSNYTAKAVVLFCFQFSMQSNYLYPAKRDSSDVSILVDDPQHLGRQENVISDNGPMCLYTFAIVDDVGAFSSKFQIPSNAIIGPLVSSTIHVAFINSTVSEDSILKTMETGLSKLSHSGAECNNMNSVKSMFENSFPLFVFGVLTPDHIKSITQPLLTISDLRPPSVVLTISSPFLIRPHDSLNIKAKVISYTSRFASYLPLDFSVSIPVKNSNLFSQQIYGNGDNQAINMPEIDGAIYFPSKRLIQIKRKLATDETGMAVLSINIPDFESSNILATGFISRDVIMVTIKVSLNGFTGELIERRADTIITQSGHHISPPKLVPFDFIVGQLVELHSSVYPIFSPTENSKLLEKPRYVKNNRSVEYSIFMISSNTSQDIDSSAVKDLDTFIKVPRDGRLISDEEIIESIRKQVEGVTIEHIGRCVAIAKRDNRCLFRFPKNQMYVIFAQSQVMNPSDNQPAVAISHSIVRKNSNASDKTVKSDVFLHTLDVRTAKKKYTSGTNIDVILQIINPFIGFIPTSQAPNTASLSYSYTDIDDDAANSSSRSSSPSSTGVISVPIRESFLAVDKIGLKDTSSLINESTIGINLGRLPAKCKPPGCQLAFMLTITAEASSGSFSSLESLRFDAVGLSILAPSTFYSADSLRITVRPSEPEVVQLDANSAQHWLAHQLRSKMDIELETEGKVQSNGLSMYSPGTDLNVNIVMHLSSDQRSLEPLQLRGEAFVLTVDKSYIDVKPFITNATDFPATIASSFSVAPQENFSSATISFFTSLLHTGGVEALQSISNLILRRWKLDPSVEIPSWPILPSNSLMQLVEKLDTADDEFFRDLASKLTAIPFGTLSSRIISFRSLRRVQSQLGFQTLKSSVRKTSSVIDGIHDDVDALMTPASSSMSKGMRVRSEAVPFLNFLRIKLEPQKVGTQTTLVGTAKIIVPDTAGTFVIKAFGSAHMKVINDTQETLHLGFGVNDTKFISGREIYIQTYLPKFMRIRDIAKIGVIVSINPLMLESISTAEYEVVAKFNDSSPITPYFKSKLEVIQQPDGSLVQTVTFKQSDSTAKAVLFPMSAGLGLGTVNVQFTLRSKVDGSAIDVLAGGFPIYEMIQAVTVGTSSMLKAIGLTNVSSEWQKHSENIQFPSLLPGYGSIEGTLSIGFTSAMNLLVRRRIDADYTEDIFRLMETLSQPNVGIREPVRDKDKEVGAILVPRHASIVDADFGSSHHNNTKAASQASGFDGRRFVLAEQKEFEDPLEDDTVIAQNTEVLPTPGVTEKKTPKIESMKGNDKEPPRRTQEVTDLSAAKFIATQDTSYPWFSSAPTEPLLWLSLFGLKEQSIFSLEPGHSKYNVPSATALVVLQAEAALCSRRGTDKLLEKAITRSRGIINAAVISRRFLSSYLLPEHFPNVKEDNPYGFLEQPWWKSYIQIPTTLKYRQLSFSRSAMAIRVLRSYVNVMKHTDCDGIVSPNEINRFSKVVAKIVSRLKKEIKLAIELEWKLYLKSKLVEISPDILSQNTTFMEFLGVSNWASLQYYLSLESPLTSTSHLVTATGNELLLSEYWKLQKNRDKESTTCTVDRDSLYLAVSIIESDNKSQLAKDFVRQCAHNAQNLVRLQGRTGYVALDTDSSSPAENSVQALAITLLSRLGASYVDVSVINSIALYLAQGGAFRYFPFIMGGYDGITLSHILNAYDSYDSITNPGLFKSLKTEKNVQLIPSIDMSIVGKIEIIDSSQLEPSKSIELISVHFKDPNFSPISNKVALNRVFHELPMRSANHLSYGVSFYTRGQGHVLMSLTSTFVPVLNESFPVYKGILVEKAFQVLDFNTNQCSGNPVLFAQRGKVLCVTLSLTVKDFLTDVVVIDYTPSGIEAVDLNIYSDTSLPEEPNPTNFASRRTGACGKPEVRLVNGILRWSCRFLRSGTTQLTYKAIANLPGVYTVSPAQAFKRANPELMGMSGASIRSFIVMDMINSLDEGLQAFGITEKPPSFLPGAGTNFTNLKGCPRCRADETCNPSTGKCVSPPLAIQVL